MAPGIPAVRGRDLQSIVAANVATCAGHICMPVCKREIDRRSGVVYARAQPTVKRVASIAGLRELRRHVIRIGSLLEIRQVAGDAGRRQALELANCGALVTVLTLYGGMRSQQWKTILVILDLLDGNVPALHGVALLAVRTHLSLVNVGVAVRAVFSDVCEYRLHVTFRAFHFLVHAAQRVFGFVMVKFGDGADRAPTRGCMAVFAGNRERAVRTAGGITLGRTRASDSWPPNEQQEPA